MSASITLDGERYELSLRAMPTHEREPTHTTTTALGPAHPLSPSDGSLSPGEDSLRGTVQQIDVASLRLVELSEQAELVANEATIGAEQLTLPAVRTARNLQSVTRSCEEMTASLAAMARSATDAAHAALAAVNGARDASAAVRSLGESGRQCASVVEGAAVLAERARLLALNAAIASAGADGALDPNFARVADELKRFAAESAETAETMGKRIRIIHGASTAAVIAITQLSTIITHIVELQTKLASAVNEQRAIRRVVNLQVAEVADDSAELAVGLGAAGASAKTVASAVAGTHRAALHLRRLADDVKLLVERLVT